MILAKRIRVTGIVQGVGFRPFIYRIAHQFGLKGFVRNDVKGVTICVEGDNDNIGKFISSISSEKPPLATIGTINVEDIPVKGFESFTIEKSRDEKDKFVLISPDVATCRDCAQEIFSYTDRRFGYPFTNCTNCGPRFTIIEDVPYDREKTTMRVFKMCPDCQSEYENPLDRRFHAQPNACPGCGPQLFLFDNQRRKVLSENPIKDTAELLRDGKIIAIKGLGGYHLACNALDSRVVSLLRERKHRFERPLAIMVKDIETVKTLCELNPAEEGLLLSPGRPIVLLRKRRETPVAEEVAPRNIYLGVMLPYTPLHHLLLAEVNIPLVMTSGNITEEPIAYKDDDAFERLGTIADYFLIHDREIHIRCDDSVFAVVRDKELPIRRSRGYVPYPILLPFEFSTPVLGCGAHLKNTFCIAKGRYGFLSHHIGDLENFETLKSFTEGIEHFKRLFYVEPELVAYDLHPDYLSTKYALSLKGVGTIGVQHHHAHIASCMLENGITSPVIGVAFDGIGSGIDGKIWGAEFLVCDLSSFQRYAHLDYVPMPGIENAIRQPWRMGLVYLREAFGDDYKKLEIPFVKRILKEKTGLAVVEEMLLKGLNCPSASSMGRLFDAVSAILNIRLETTYEGQGAIDLQMQASPQIEGFYQFKLEQEQIPWRIDVRPLIREIVDDIRCVSSDVIAGKFHNTIAKMIVDISTGIRSRTGIDGVALSGGVFQNTLLVEKVLPLLESAGFRIFTHSKVPPNDGGISLGQVGIAYSKTHRI